MFKTCFLARISLSPSTNSFISCRYDAVPAKEWQSPPADNLLAFCFPSGVSNVKPKEYMSPDEFSFTLTAGDGSRLHGFCRRTLTPAKVPAEHKYKLYGSKQTQMRYPQVLCIVSQHPWFPFFYKVLELVEKLLRQEDLELNSTHEWPDTSPAAMFLTELLRTAAPWPQLGQIIRVPLPQTELPLEYTPPRRALTGLLGNPLLHADNQSVELEVPPDLGLGPSNAGISAARLLFHLPPRVALTLISSLLMERRIILTSSTEDKVSAAVHAAAAIIYPFKWHHIYLPLLPVSLKDYLAAPMPYLAGVTSNLLPLLRNMALEEVLLVDLDLGECSPPPDNSRDDAFLLPFASKLLNALETCKDGTLSFTEFNSTPFIASIMQEYFIKLVGKYRLFVQPDVAMMAQHSRNRKKNDTVLRAHGLIFDQESFIAHHKSPAVRDFLSHFRHSQMFEVFVTERLRIISTNALSDDPFEVKVSQYLSKQTLFGSHAAIGAPQLSSNRISSMLKKTASMVRQSSDNVIKGLKSLGSTHEEAYMGMARKASSSVTSLHQFAPGGSHSFGQTSSFRGQQGRSQSHTYLPSKSSSNNLARLSPVFPGGTHHKPVSLEHVKAEDFFGDVEDDAASVKSDRSNHSQADTFSPETLHNRTSASLFQRSSGSVGPSAMLPQRQAELAKNGSDIKFESFPSLVALDAHTELQPSAQPNHQQRMSADSGVLGLMSTHKNSSSRISAAIPSQRDPIISCSMNSQENFFTGAGTAVVQAVSPAVPSIDLTSQQGPFHGSQQPQHCDQIHDFGTAWHHVGTMAGDLQLSNQIGPDLLNSQSVEQSPVTLPLTCSIGLCDNSTAAQASTRFASRAPQRNCDSLASLKGGFGQTQGRGRDSHKNLPSAAALGSKLARRGDVFGGLLAATISSVSADLVRRRTSSQTVVSTSTDAAAVKHEDLGDSWAVFQDSSTANEGNFLLTSVSDEQLGAALPTPSHNGETVSSASADLKRIMGIPRCGLPAETIASQCSTVAAERGLEHAVQVANRSPDPPGSLSDWGSFVQ